MEAFSGLIETRRKMPEARETQNEACHYATLALDHDCGGGHDIRKAEIADGEGDPNPNMYRIRHKRTSE